MSFRNMGRNVLALLLLPAGLVFAQAPAGAPSASAAKAPDRAAAYYHFSMAHLYEQLAREYRSTDYVNKAIEEYKLAIQADPGSDYLSSELVDLYAQAGRLNDAVAEADAVLQRDPKNVQMRRVLGRIYRGYLADPGQGKLNEDLLKRAIEQYEKIVEIDPKDTESYLHLSNLYRVGHDSVKAEAALKKVLEIDPHNEEALTDLAAVYSEIGDTNGAIDMLSRVSQKRPNSRLLAALGAAYEQANQNDKAIEALEKAVQLDHSNMDARRALGRNLLLAEQWDKALAQYETLAKADPQDPQNYLRLSQIYRQKRQFDKARAALEKAAALSPSEMIEVPYNEVLLLESEGKLDQAIAAMQKLIDSTAKPAGTDYTPRERSNRAFFYEKLGLLERSRENYPAAEKAFHAMAEADPESASRASIQLIESYRGDRDFKRALSESEAAFKKFPKDRSVALVRASVLADAGDAKQGAQILRGLMKNTPDDRDLLLALSQVLEKGKMFTEAEQAVEKARSYATTPEQKRGVYFTMGSLLERQKKYDEAEKQFRQVLVIDPNDASTLNYLGYMLADQNVRLDEAYNMIKKAVEIEPDNGAYLDSLGWVYYRQNKLDLAEELLLRAVQKTERDPTVHEHLGDVYFAAGKLRLAHDQWQRSLKEWDTSAKADFDPDDVAKLQKKLENVKFRLAQEQNGAKPRR
ncbi:MAG TPA: tetratricopeptide repeat protein [Bryobacterales bacterium]|nr:tetratricopeptide repeat protein [Bryobacterales bacterium]